MGDHELASDCERCCALCCLAHSFERSASFAFDKPALEPCPNLRDDNRCDVHSNLAAHGMAGCARYECGGAGPRVVHEVFGGDTWRVRPELASPMACTLCVIPLLPAPIPVFFPGAEYVWGRQLGEFTINP